MSVPQIIQQRTFPLAPIPPMSAQGLNGRSHAFRLYAATCNYIDNFGIRLGVQIVKIGVTGRRDVDQRMADLERKGYGRVVKAADHPDTELPGSGNWHVLPVEADIVPRLHLQRASVSQGTLLLQVPASMTLEGLDDKVKDCLEPCGLNSYLASSAGQEALRRAGMPDSTALVTRYSLMTVALRVSLAGELYAFDPVAGSADIAAALGKAAAVLDRN